MTTSLLITGANGSIGTKLRGHFGTQPGYRLRLLGLGNTDPAVVSADLAYYDPVWAQLFAGCDTVIHLAGDPYFTASWASVQRNNIDGTLNVFRAAEAHGVRRVVFASSNWVMAGYCGTQERITTSLPPWPVNPYGNGKLLGERAGKALAERTGISFIALRIGYCQHAAGNVPGPHMELGLWGQQMWLSDRDLCHGVEGAVLARDVPFAILNLMSNNPGMRWDIDETRRAIDYLPRDGHVAMPGDAGSAHLATLDDTRAPPQAPAP